MASPVRGLPKLNSTEGINGYFSWPNQSFMLENIGYSLNWRGMVFTRGTCPRHTMIGWIVLLLPTQIYEENWSGAQQPSDSTTIHSVMGLMMMIMMIDTGIIIAHGRIVCRTDCYIVIPIVRLLYQSLIYCTSTSFQWPVIHSALLK